MIALPNLSTDIDEGILEMLFEHPKYCTDDNMSIQKIYELNYDENHTHRLVVILFTHSEGKYSFINILKTYIFLSKLNKK